MAVLEIDLERRQRHTSSLGLPAPAFGSASCSSGFLRRSGLWFQMLPSSISAIWTLLVSLAILNLEQSRL